MLDYLEKLTVTPEAITAADVVPLREAGLDDAAIEEALYVSMCFNFINRIADAFAFKLPDARELKWSARMLFRLGYSMLYVRG